jgi:hypothetical protein
MSASCESPNSGPTASSSAHRPLGNVSSHLKQFLDTLDGRRGQGLLSNKVHSGFTSTGTAYGG